MPAEWFDDHRVWELTYPFMFPAESFERARDEVEQLVELTGCDSGAVLDLACGPGRHAVPFAARGFDVTAVDRTPFLLERARKYAKNEGAHVTFVEQDMRAPLPEGRFDLAVCLFTSFGLFADDRDNRAVLERVHDALRPGARFVVDVLGKEIIARHYQPTGSRALEDGRLLVQRRHIVDGWMRMENEWLIVDGDEVTRLPISHWLYSGRELRDMLFDAGFAEVDLFGDLKGASYNSDARRLVAVARK